MEYFRTGDVIKQAWAVVKKHLLFVWITLIIIFGVQGLASIFATVVEDQALLSIAVSILSSALTIVLELGFIRVYLDLVDKDQESPFGTLFSTWQYFWQYLGATILYLIGVVVGLILLVVPGIYVVLTYQFYGYLIVDKQLGVLEALKRSAEMTKGLKWQLFVFALALAGLNLMGALVLLIGLFVTVPVSIVAYVMVYRILSKRLEAQTILPNQPLITPSPLTDENVVAGREAVVVPPSSSESR